MRLFLFTSVVVLAILIKNANTSPLDVVSNKSGEEQVKAALEKAERESEQAAKEQQPGKDKKKEGTPEKETSKAEKEVKTEEPHESHESKDDKDDTAAKFVADSENKPDEETQVKKDEEKDIKEKEIKEKEIKEKEETASKETIVAKQNEHAFDKEKEKEREETTSKETITAKQNEHAIDKEKGNGREETASKETVTAKQNEHAIDKEKEKEREETASKGTIAAKQNEHAIDKEIEKEREETASKETIVAEQNEHVFAKTRKEAEGSSHIAPTTTRSAQSDVDEESNKRMTEMARKLSTLVSRFQKKIALNRLRKVSNEDVTSGGRKSLRAKTTSGLGLEPLGSNGPATGYKEDTRLEDRLAMEAEEERKFNNGETYDDNEDYGLGDNVKSYAGTTSLSPKEQASQEMQSYNALISSESNRELSQIQDEISKSTQSSMGGVSIDGEHSQVPVESPAPTNDLGASLNGISNLGGDINGALSGIDAGTPGAGGAEISQASDLGGDNQLTQSATTMGASEGAGTPEGGEETQSPMAGMESATVEGNIQASQMNTDGGLPAGITGALADSQSLGGNFAGGSPPMEMYNKKRSKIKSPSSPKVRIVKKHKITGANSKRKSKRTFVRHKTRQ